MDFLRIESSLDKKPEIYPVFLGQKSKDLMIRAKEFYAVWDEERGLWSNDIFDLIRLVDNELDKYYEEHKAIFYNKPVSIKYMGVSNSNSMKKFVEFIKLLPDTFTPLNSKIMFANSKITKKDYVTKTLPYSKEPGDISAYNELISVLYSPEEREKFEWAIGSIIEGDSKTNQKFFVFYGPPGSGKSTVMDIIVAMFDGYCVPFDAKALGSINNQFATEPFKSNPLVAIQQDGDLSRIEDNTKINSIVSHDIMVVNEKHKAQYQMRFNALLFMGTNTPVRITDDKSGIKRRLVDIRPTGNLVPRVEYDKLKSEILSFELGAIADYCQQKYLELGKKYYDRYEPKEMQLMTDDFMDFMEENYPLFKKQNYTFLRQAYDLYKQYAEDSQRTYRIPKREFRYKLKDYFRTFKEEDRIVIGGEEKHIRSYYEGFKTEKFEMTSINAGNIVTESLKSWIEFKEQESKLDILLQDCFAQYANAREIPSYKWSDCKTRLRDIITTKLHYVKVPENHIVIDFDLKDENGNKSYELNYEAASKFPKTYAELSKSGCGIHLHYIYSGDVTQLERVYDNNPEIEIKVFTGNSSLRRKLTKCNNLDIAKINSGLPLKEKKEDKMVNQEVIKSEKSLRALIIRNLRKEIHPGTKPSIDFIYKILEDAYESGLKYDVSDLYPDISAFALGSTHKAEYCMDMVSKMKFKSEDDVPPDIFVEDKLVFFDCEVFPNLFLINWKFQGKENPVVRMINPTPEEVSELSKYKLVGFNCRRYDNHILYARMLGFTNEELFEMSQRIINGSDNAFFTNAYNLSYTDVYDFCSTKQSLKKWEIDLGIHHHELGMKWDESVPEEKWALVAEYCDDDVIATEAVFDENEGDFIARQILAELAGGTVNDTTNQLTAKLIFGDDKRPQSDFCYRDLAQPVNVLRDDQLEFYKKYYPEMISMPFYINGETSILPFFPGYKFDSGKSFYMGVEVGEGGRVWSAPGMYGRTFTFDSASHHPNSAATEYHFGKYTNRFYELLRARVFIKHGEFDKAGELFDGKLKPYLKVKSKAKQLAYALKIAINSVYGLTAAKFANLFKDPRNKDNIVAKRGALFMINLQHEVEKLGGQVIHIKTDSIKVVNPSKEISEFIVQYSKRYGYTFEIEHIYEKICLVNDAVYIAKCAEDDPDPDMRGKWTATGTQFAVPYVFKTLFTKEPIEFSDLCETKSVSSGSMYLDMNERLEDVSLYEKELERREHNKNYPDKKQKLNPQFEDYTDEDIKNLISKGHSYVFVGKTGLFTPMKEGTGGGILYREKDGKYYAVTGTKGYRWLESEVVKSSGRDGDIDVSYYEKLAEEAKATISEYGDFEAFVSENYI